MGPIGSSPGPTNILECKNISASKFILKYSTSSVNVDNYFKVLSIHCLKWYNTVGKLVRSQNFHDTDRLTLYIFEGLVSTILRIWSQLTSQPIDQPLLCAWWGLMPTNLTTWGDHQLPSWQTTRRVKTIWNGSGLISPRSANCNTEAVEPWINSSLGAAQADW